MIQQQIPSPTRRKHLPLCTQETGAHGIDPALGGLKATLGVRAEQELLFTM